MSASIYKATTNMSKLTAEVERTGDEIVIRRHNVPVAKLVRIARRPRTDSVAARAGADTAGLVQPFWLFVR